MTNAETELTPFPWHRKCPYQPPEEYAQLRPETPIAKVGLRTGREAYVVTSYEHVRKLLTEPNASSDRGHEGFPYYIDIPPQFRTEGSFIGWDPPKHTVYRRMAAVSGEFTKQRVRAMLPRIEQIVDERIDAMLEQGGPVDLVTALALPVPLTIVCEILGIPHQDHDYLHDRTDKLFGGKSSAEVRMAAITELNGYLAGLLEKKLKEPGEDLISRIVVRFHEAGLYDSRELVNLVRLLLNGGHETSAAMIAIGAMTLLEHPDQLEKLKNDWSLAPNAVEELLRYLTPGDLASSRVALADIDAGPVTIKEGEGMIICGGAANRDPETFPEPDKFDITRPNARNHVAFGYGVHHCIGAEIARVELTVVLTKLFQRIPTLKLAKPWNELQYKDGAVMYGVYEMPVTW
ncbi:cytochrome P450 [Lentzea sp. NPDC058436]|uniref:cytochrome P450 n=1 Tax=Lentzea sp. NPDC058436 TaxID=3346499 RepID=UPI00365CEBA5